MNIAVQTPEDYMTAHIVVRVDKGESAPTLTEAELYSALDNKGVNTGIDSKSIKQIVSQHIYNQAVCVANGTPPGVGENAKIEILKKPKKKKDITAPKTTEGAIDYYSPREGFLVFARKDDILAVKYPPSRGTPGKDVLGHVIPGRLGKEISLELFKGKNTSIADDKIIAEADGIIEMQGIQINVLTEYEINDNIGKNTGSTNLPLDLNCKLVIKGDIQRGYKISCSDLHVYGCIEDAEVSVKNLEVKEGIVGVGEQKVTAENIRVRYINGSRIVYANTIIVLKEISNGAKVYSNLMKTYAIQGSTVVARDAIWTDFVNGNNSITVGVDYQAKMQYDELSRKIKVMENPIDELKTQDFLNAKKMKKLAELARINPKSPVLRKELPKIREAKEKLERILKLRMELISKREEIAEKIYSKGVPFLLVHSNFGKDSSSENVVEPNITITLRDKSLKIMETMPGGLFTIGPYGITHSSRYDIKEIKRQFDDYLDISK
ncbi:flagellar assembly protein A [candidate division KSB1 bacterium]